MKVRVRYAIIIEGELGNYSAYVPDLPGCVATGESLDEITQEMREAIKFHIEGLQEDNLPIPEPITQVDTIEI